MIYKAVFEEEAARELDNILEYIAFQLCNPAAANNLLDDVQKTIEQIAHFHFGFPLCEQTQLANNEVRKCIVKNFVMFYALSNDTILILHIKYAKSNLTNVIKV